MAPMSMIAQGIPYIAKTFSFKNFMTILDSFVLVGMTSTHLDMWSAQKRCTQAKNEFGNSSIKSMPYTLNMSIMMMGWHHIFPTYLAQLLANQAPLQ